MNISPIVSAVKGFAASEGGKAVVKIVKNVGMKTLQGVGVGASAGMLVVGTKFGYKAATKGVPAVCKPIVEVLDKMTAGEPAFTVTFTELNAKKQAENQKADGSEEKSEESK